MLWWKPFDADDVATLTGLIAAGGSRPIIDRRYPLDEIVEALRYVDEGRPAGKVVIEISIGPGAAARRRRQPASYPPPGAPPACPDVRGHRAQRGSAAASAGCSRRRSSTTSATASTVAAGPLLVASLTRDPFLVSLAVLSEYLPSLLFGIAGGAVADRVDRRRMVVVVNVGRAVDAGGPRRTRSSAESVNIAIVLVGAVRPRDRGDLRGLRQQHPPPEPRDARGPRPRERPDAGRDAA